MSPFCFIQVWLFWEVFCSSLFILWKTPFIETNLHICDSNQIFIFSFHQVKIIWTFKAIHFFFSKYPSSLFLLKNCNLHIFLLFRCICESRRSLENYKSLLGCLDMKSWGVRRSRPLIDLNAWSVLIRIPSPCNDELTWWESKNDSS